MEDDLAIINRIIEWHQTIRGHVRLVGEAINDQEALLVLERTRPDWIPGQPEVLAEKQKKLQQTLGFLDEGLRNHFAYEEKALPLLLGELFMRALVLDHREIHKEIDDSKSTIAAIKPEGLSRDELLARESQIQQLVANMCQLVEEHATREEIILEMVRRALEDKKQDTG